MLPSKWLRGVVDLLSKCEVKAKEAPTKSALPNNMADTYAQSSADKMNELKDIRSWLESSGNTGTAIKEKLKYGNKLAEDTKKEIKA